MFRVRDYQDEVICPSATSVLKVLSRMSSKHVSVEFTRPSGCNSVLFITAENETLRFTYNDLPIPATLFALEKSLRVQL